MRMPVCHRSLAVQILAHAQIQWCAAVTVDCALCPRVSPRTPRSCESLSLFSLIGLVTSAILSSLFNSFQYWGIFRPIGLLLDTEPHWLAQTASNTAIFLFLLRHYPNVRSKRCPVLPWLCSWPSQRQWQSAGLGDKGVFHPPFHKESESKTER